MNKTTVEEVTCPICGQQLLFRWEWYYQRSSDDREHAGKPVRRLASDSDVCPRCGRLEVELRSVPNSSEVKVVIHGRYRPSLWDDRKAGDVVNILGIYYVFDGRTFYDRAIIPPDWNGIPQGNDWLVIADHWADRGDASKEWKARRYAG